MEELNLNVISEKIESKIYLIRGRKVMLDRDLTKLYGVETKVLNQSVKRNMERFPDDFAFQLNNQEVTNWKSQIVTSNSGLKMGLRRAPWAFTDYGILMLSSVLRSQKAILVNIQIMRTFARLREMVNSLKALLEEIRRVERKGDMNYQIVFEALEGSNRLR